jgi:hypothetical protein
MFLKVRFPRIRVLPRVHHAPGWRRRQQHALAPVYREMRHVRVSSPRAAPQLLQYAMYGTE